ncbi:MAG: M14 family metallopeptidase [bacterium]
MTPWPTDAYLDWPALEAWCRDAAAAHPGWVVLSEIGRTLEDRPILLLTIGANDGRQDERPGFWLDGGTHAAEWTGVMAVAHTASTWISALAAGDAAEVAWFQQHTAYLVPCICPDGFQATMAGGPYVRSTPTPPAPGSHRSGLDPCDLDGDGAVRWMRWYDPAGPFVADADVPLFLRARTLDDDPEKACFACTEGEFIHWDGQRWTEAPLKHGLDLNRNFAARWAPFTMFGMDGGRYPLSAAESRAITEAVAARPFIAAALTHHTYTGALLTQPYRRDSPIGDTDQRLMEALGRDAVKGTGYAVFRVHPEFTYDESQPITGVWADSLACTFGIPGYTLELWNPFEFAGVERPNVAEFFRNPEPSVVRKLIAFYAGRPEATPWKAFDHPQLGPVELGGIDYMRTIRNPPLEALPTELGRGLRVADRLRRALPRVQARLECTAVAAGLTEVVLVLENQGYLATSGLAQGEKVKACPGVVAALDPGEELDVIQGALEQGLTHLDGWATLQHTGAGHPVYPGLAARGHRAVARWWVRGEGRLVVRYTAGRGGTGELEAEI